MRLSTVCDPTLTNTPVVGYSYTAGDAAVHAFSWTQAGGLVVGYSNKAGEAAVHAFSWTQAGGMVDLGTLGGSTSVAQAVNDAGQVVGDSNTAGDVAQHAFSWTQAGGLVDLGTLGGSTSVAQAVNDAGQVVGYSGTAGDVAQHAVLWQTGTPTTAEDCKKGGWQSYGTFKNQGDCVSYVKTHGKNPPR